MKSTERQKGYSAGYSAALRRADIAEKELRRLQAIVKVNPPEDQRASTIEFCLNGAEAMLKAASFLLTNEIPSPQETTNPRER